jgi:uncharacterized membrane protein YgdD (TMEM256/DUF423 family)
MDRLFLLMGTLFAGLSVALGAFAAHGLRDRIAESLLANFETAARYQMYHALALLATAWLVTRLPESALPVWAGWAFVAGIVVFSGSLYALSLTGARWLGAITPIGGVAFLAGWICLALGAWQAR